MAIHPDIRDEAFLFFVQEAPELLQVIEAELLEIRENCNVERVHALMRAAHTIKGGSANVGLEAIKAIAHRLEDFFRCLYNPDLEIDGALERLFLQGYDCLRIPLMEAIQVGDQWEEGEAALAVAEPIFAQLQERLADFITDEDHLPSVAEMGIDIAQSIFETDVAQALERLEAIEGDVWLIGAELRAQAEVFEGIAELLNLPGLTQITHLVMAALDAEPERAIDLFPIALENFQAAHRAVLDGDRTQGGMPSIALQTFIGSGETGDRTTASDEVWSGVGEYIASDQPWFESPMLEGEAIDQSFFREMKDDPGGDGNFEDRTVEDEDPSSVAAELERIFSSHTTNVTNSEAIASFLADLESVFRAQDAVSCQEEQPVSSLNDLESVFGSLGNGSPKDWLTSESQTSDLESVFAEPLSSAQAAHSDDVAGFELGDRQEAESPVSEAEPLNLDDLSPIGSSITSVQQKSNSLPVVSEPPSVELHPTKVKKSPATREAISSPQPITSDSQISVRLNLAQLERISNQLGELSINRNSLSLQNEQLQDTLQELRRRFGYFLSIGTQLQSHLNKLLISPDRYSLLQSPSPAVLTRDRGGTATILLEKTADSSYRASFDTLELDRYNEVYNLLQDATESIQQLDEAVEDVTLFAEQSDRGLEQQRQILTVLRDELMWARMLPLGNILNRFPRQIKDLSYQYNKPVSLKLIGTEVLVDKVVLEKLYDPLLHLLRNAFDHGIEPENIRKRQGKPEQGRIEIRVYHRGSRTIIEIEDDGRGINLERIRVKAVETGMLTSDAAKTASTERLLNLIFEPGFSTASQVSELSGRGVGLDIVRAQIQSLKGSITVNSQPAKGTLFTLRIPLTLSISKLLLTWSGQSLSAIPSDSIEEIVNPQPTDVKTSGEQHFLHWRGQVIPIHPLQDLMPFYCVLPTVEANLSFNSVPTPEDWAAPLLILRQGNQPFALQVDRLITEQELVVKPFSDTLPAPNYLYGCTILGDGSVVPVVDAVTLLLHRQGHRPTAIAPAELPSRPVQTTPTILIVDDAATMRQMLTLTLKKAGYQVIQARDGREALDQLHQHAHIQLVICDIEMPIMNGFEFLTHRRQNPALLNVPVIMLTSRSGEKHRKLALHLGATHYFTKPYIEQQFLAHLNALLQSKVNS